MTCTLIVSTGCIRWILWFSVRYAAAHREIFSVNALRKTTAGRFTKFAGYLHCGVSFSGKENSLILKNKMSAAGISLKIIYIFTPLPLRAVRVLFSPMVSGWAVRRREIVCSGCISETVRCRKFILGRDIGWGV